MRKTLLLTIALITVFLSCSKTKNQPVEVQTDSDPEISVNTDYPTSSLQFPINYPVGELEQMMNRIMPDTLVNDSISLDDKGDLLVLKIIPLGELMLNSYRDNLDASIPVEVLVNIKKKVLAFNIKNKKPIKFKLRMDVHLDLDIDENFDLATTCKLQAIHWIEAPETNILGIKINLQSLIDKQLDKNSKVIENEIANALNKIVPIKKEVMAIWHILNQPHRVAKKPIDIWLSTRPKTFNAWFDSEVQDTIRAIVSTKSAIIVTPLAGLKTESYKDLPLNEITDSQEENALDLKVSVALPYIYADSIINDMLSETVLNYQGLEVVLENAKVSQNSNRLALDFILSGAIEIEVSASMIPALNEEKELIIEDIDYKIKTDNPLIESVEWLTSNELEIEIQKRTKVPLAHILDSLDSKIMAALEKSNLGSKIALDLNFSLLESDTIRYYTDRFEWCFDVKGKAYAYLSDSIVNKLKEKN